MGWWTSRLRMRLRRRSTRWYFSERETVYKLYIWRKISKLKPQPFSWTWTWTSPKTWICICKRKKTTKWMWKKRRGTTWTSRLRIKSTRWWMRRTSISPRDLRFSEMERWNMKKFSRILENWGCWSRVGKTTLFQSSSQNSYIISPKVFICHSGFGTCATGTSPSPYFVT